MVRISKQTERRSRSPRKPRLAGKKTGPRPDKLPLGYKEHPNALEGEHAATTFIPRIK